MTETTTLWNILTDTDYLVIHLPRFALFLVVAIPLLIVCDRKRNTVACTFATVFLMLCTGIFGLAGIYYFMTAHIYPGYRFPIPVWYYPIALSILLFATGMFIFGLRKNGRHSPKILLICRIVIFLITAAFSLRALASPHKINRQLEARENAQGHRASAPAMQPPKDSP